MRSKFDQSDLTPPRSTRGSLRLLAIVMMIVTIAAPLSTAAATSTHGPARPSLVSREQMNAQTLIQAGVIEGSIDYPTSLVYRAYALFADPRLPGNLDGLGSTGEDHGFFLEARKNWDKLPADVRNLLIPFTVRPNDVRSHYFQSDATPAAGELQTETTVVPADEGVCQDGWVTRNGPQFPYKLWMHCTGDYDGDFDAAIELIDSFWEKEVEIMGDPLPDGGSDEQGGDTRIDFYFVDDEADQAPRRGGIGIEESVAAFAASEEPVVGKASSAFVVARRPYIGNPQLSLTLSHEYFHVLQYAHNWEIGFGFKGTPYTSDFDVLSFVEAWFVEASADWMKSYIWRDRLSADEMQAYLHYRFTQNFQGVDVSLVLSTPQSSTLLSHSYASYVYFLFLEQRLGAQAIGDFWRDLEDVEADDFTRMTEVLDEQLPFKENFRDFAVQNFNLELQPGDPIEPRYQDIDPTFPYDGPALNFAKGQNGRLPLIESADDEPKVFEESIHNLSAHYYYFTPNKDSDYVTLDFTNLSPNEFVDIDLLVKVRDGKWERRQFTASDPITFCRENPDDDVETIYAIVSNHAIYDRETVEGSFSAGAFSGECP
jgi:hypothetical protein